MATASDVAKSILAGLGNDSPTQSQVDFVQAWIQAEGLFGSSLPQNNNPLAITGTAVELNVKPYLARTGQGSISYTIPNPTQNGGNPVVQFSSITDGIIAASAYLQTSTYVQNITNALKTPQQVDYHQLGNSLSTAAFGGDGQTIISILSGGTPTDTTGGGTIDIGTGTTTVPGATGSTCTLAQSVSLPGGGHTSSPGDIVDYIQCLVKADAATAVANGESIAGKLLPRIGAYVVGIVLVIIGVIVFVVDDVKVAGISLRDEESPELAALEESPELAAVE